MRELRSRRIGATSAARTRGMPSTRQQPSRVIVAASTRQRRTPGRHHRGKSVAHTAVNNDRAETGPSGQATVAPTSDADEVTAAGAANGQSNPVEAADDPVPGADEDMAMDAANDQPNPVEAADDPAPDAEPGLTAEEMRKEKEVLFLRHKLQKGLLTRDQDPKEEEMKQMSKSISRLEGYADLEVSILRATKIHKVLKAILKLNSIPKEEIFQFKLRSQTLLDKWNELLAGEQGTPAAAGADEGTAMDSANNQSDPIEAAANDPTTNVATSPGGPVEATANESAMAASGGDEDMPMDARNDQPGPVEVAADDLATNEIEDDDNDEEMPEYVWSFFQGLEDIEDSSYAGGDNLTSNNVPSRTFRPRDQLGRHHQQRDLHVEYVATVLDRVVAQVQGRDGEVDTTPGDSLEDFLHSELDATGVTIGVLNWLITKHIPKYRMQLRRSLRQVRQDRA